MVSHVHYRLEHLAWETLGHGNHRALHADSGVDPCRGFRRGLRRGFWCGFRRGFWCGFVMDSAWNFRQYRKPTYSEQGNWGAGRARRFLKRTQKRTSRATSGRLWGKPEESKPRYLDPYTQSGGVHHCGCKLPQKAPSNICWRILGKDLSALFPHSQEHFPMRKSATNPLSCLTGLTPAREDGRGAATNLHWHLAPGRMFDEPDACLIWTVTKGHGFLSVNPPSRTRCKILEHLPGAGCTWLRQPRQSHAIEFSPL